MPGIFNVTGEPTLQQVSLDEIRERAKASGAESFDKTGIAKVFAHLVKVAETNHRYLLEIKGHDGLPLLQSRNVDAAEAASKVIALFEAIPDVRQRRRLLKELRHEGSSERRKNATERKNLDNQMNRLKVAENAFNELFAWPGLQEPILERPATTVLHKLRENIADREVVYWCSTQDPWLTEEQSIDYLEMLDTASTFVVEHNWSKAFAGAGDFDGGELRLPDEVCVFEFRISGRHVLALATMVDGNIAFELAVQCTIGAWSMVGHDSPATNLKGLVADEIRAIAIALDAEVAATEIVRAPHRLNHARERRGAMPIYDYHVVSLARRSRAPALPVAEDHEPTRKVRLHFRRGHWRHFDNHKTWIKWMLVGNPDLGFVDKHYRL